MILQAIFKVCSGAHLSKHREMLNWTPKGAIFGEGEMSRRRQGCFFLAGVQRPTNDAIGY